MDGLDELVKMPRQKYEVPTKLVKDMKPGLYEIDQAMIDRIQKWKREYEQHCQKKCYCKLCHEIFAPE